TERLDWRTFFSHIQRETAAASMEVEKAEAKAQGKAQGESAVLHHTPKAYALGLVFGAAAAEVVIDGKKHVAVAQLRKDYPAERGGLEVNDILLDINGRGIRSKQDYIEAIDGTSRSLEIKILRNNEILVKKIDLY
ncbi:MAG: PDZ domain-containing protein, partial [Planctomycetaceae bacterium]|nr:PDZ domain-containing protein [Planctomycetaceae bacterium]